MRAGYAGLPTYKKSARRRRNRHILAVGMALLVLTLAAPFLTTPCARALGLIPLFRAERIEVTGLLYLSPDEVRSWVPVRERENLLLVHPDEVASALRLHPRIQDARVTRHPGRLRIDVSERRTFLLVNAGTLLEVDQTGTILSPLDRCTCELQAPAPFPALPRESGLRGAERGSDGGLAGWIESGALASASTPIPEWASRPGEVCPRIDGLRPSDSQTAAILARGHRGLLDLLCVARC